eukprot:TRINITY_DN77350_c0_g1_i1.p1 TRINITY_DN77350_c0_g1~~TRINITY_DN77350_c0_g1_i1.p1  ORF type:complete len:317 (+),score=50.93 TRINITY_DN77350_c0_g1_i1:63-1013(+)
MGSGCSSGNRIVQDPCNVKGSSDASPCQLIDGKAIAQAAQAQVKLCVQKMLESGHPAPCLVVVVVGSDPASATYIKRKHAAAAECGIIVRQESFDEDITHEDLVGVVQRLNADPTVHGIIVQLPLPKHVDAPSVTGAVAASKDVDGFTATNIGGVALAGQQPDFAPCTPKGCLRLIKSVCQSLRGREAVVIGASNIVGVPMLLMLLQEGCTVECCHIDTADTATHARRADILVVAVGKAGLVRREWVKPGAIVIDVGINFVPDDTKKGGMRMVGDCASDVREVAGYLTPVPGGVGPMTVAMLMENTFEAAQRAVQE